MRIGTIVLSVAAVGLAGAALLLLSSSDPELDASAPVVDEPRGQLSVKPPATGPVRGDASPGTPSVGGSVASAGAATDEREQPDKDVEPRPRFVKDAGPVFDPYDPKMIGDPAYDRMTRISAAHRLYARQDYEAALQATRELIAEGAEEPRVRRLLVVTACAMGEVALAREHAALLPELLREYAERQCERSGTDIRAR